MTITDNGGNVGITDSADYVDDTDSESRITRITPMTQIKNQLPESVKSNNPCKSVIQTGYKQTEVGVIPEDWEPSMLCMITSEIGDGIHSTPVYSSSGTYFFINGNNICNGRIEVSENTKVVDYSEFKKHKKNLGDRTILLSINGTIGNLGLFAGESVVLGKSAAYLNVVCEIEKKYVYYYLQAEVVRRQFNDGLTGTTISNLGLATIRNTQVALPPTKAEQEAIAEALSDTDALIESLEQLITKKRHLKHGAMQELLTGKKRLPGFSGEWEVKPLGELGHFLKGSGVRKDESLSGDLPCIRYGEIYTKHNYYIKTFYSGLSPKVAATAQLLKRCDILFAGSGETKAEIGKCVAFVDYLEAYAGGDIVILRPDCSSPTFLGYYLTGV
jgi:type I restriction enzyme S subunit